MRLGYSLARSTHLTRIKLLLRQNNSGFGLLRVVPFSYFREEEGR